MSKKSGNSLLTPEILRQAVWGSFKKFDPRYMSKNPVMFVVEVGFVIPTPTSRSLTSVPITLYNWKFTAGRRNTANIRPPVNTPSVA